MARALDAPDRRFDGLMICCSEPALSAVFGTQTVALASRVIVELGGIFEHGVLRVSAGATTDAEALIEALSLPESAYPRAILQLRTQGALALLLTQFAATDEADVAAHLALATPRVELQALGALHVHDLQRLTAMANAGTLRGPAVELLPDRLPSLATGLLVEALFSGGHTHREAAGRALGRLPIRQSAAAWRRLLQSEDHALVLDAADALSRIEGGIELARSVLNASPQTRLTTLALARVHPRGSP